MNHVILFFYSYQSILWSIMPCIIIVGVSMDEIFPMFDPALNHVEEAVQWSSLPCFFTVLYWSEMRTTRTNENATDNIDMLMHVKKFEYCGKALYLIIHWVKLYSVLYSIFKAHGWKSITSSFVFLKIMVYRVTVKLSGFFCLFFLFFFLRRAIIFGNEIVKCLKRVGFCVIRLECII